MSKAAIYRHTEDMGEISGFGGAYEKTCQDMLANGVKWLAERPDAGLEGHSFKNIYGIFTPDSDDAKEMEKAVMAGIHGASGAMHHAVMSRLFFIAAKGWDAYCAEIRNRKEKTGEGK